MKNMSERNQTPVERKDPLTPAERRTALTPAERKARFKEKDNSAEARQKQRERAREDLARFHIRRNELYGYEIPAAVPRDALFDRVREEYLAEVAKPVEVSGE